MTREEYEEIASAYQQTYLGYSKMVRKTNPESWTVEAAVKELEELRLLMKQYENEHPEEFRGQGGNDDPERAGRPREDSRSPGGGSKDDILADEAFLKELEAMSDPDEPTVDEPEPALPKALLLERLREAGVARASVEYDGACDSGCIEHVSAFGSGGEGVTLAADLRELVEEYVYERLPRGWEIDDGSFGEVEIDVTGGTVTFDHKQRYTEYQQWEE
jgi:hypothetical protein